MSTAHPQADRLYTAADLQALGDDFRGELVDGHLVSMTPTNFRHGKVELRLGAALLAWCAANAPHLDVGAGEVGFILSHAPDVVRAADLAVIERSAASPTVEGFVDGAPLVAIEVLSPSNSVSEMERTLEDYLRAGTRSVWMVDPASGRVVIYRSLREREVFTGDATVTDPALPGFSAALAEIFRD